MREILHQLAVMPGVVGSMACGTNGEILASEFSSIFEEPALRRVGSLLAGESSVLKKMVGGDGSLDLRYAGGRAIVKPFATGALFVLCTSAINPQLLGMWLAEASRRLKKCDVATAPSTATPAPPVALVSELADAREALQRAVVRQIGPIGEMVFAQAWDDWTASAPPSRAGLERLVSLLAHEIDEGEGRARFLSEATAIIARQEIPCKPTK